MTLNPNLRFFGTSEGGCTGVVWPESWLLEEEQLPGEEPILGDVLSHEEGAWHILDVDVLQLCAVEELTLQEEDESRWLGDEPGYEEGPLLERGCLLEGEPYIGKEC